MERCLRGRSALVSSPAGSGLGFDELMDWQNAFREQSCLVEIIVSRLWSRVTAMRG